MQLHTAGHSSRLRTVLIWAAAFLAGAAVFHVMPQRELPLYLKAGERMLHGERIYRPDERAFTYPPLFALPFVPLALLPEALQRPVWYVITFAALALILPRLARRLEPGLAPAPGRGAPPRWLFWLLVALLAARHVLSPLENQSHDLLILLAALLAIDALCGRRDLGAGLAAGVGAALKATPLLFAPVFLWQRRFVAFAVLLLALVGGTFLPDLVCPARDGASWSVTWYRTFINTIKPGETATNPGAWYPWNQLNQSLAGTCYRLFMPKPEAQEDQTDVSIAHLGPDRLKYATLGAQLAVVAALCWVTRRRWTEGLPEGERVFLTLGQGAAVVTAMVLLSPTSIKTHFCVLLLPIAFCLADFLHRRRDPLVGLALTLAFVLGTLTVKGILTGPLGDQVLACGSVTWCAVALFLATGRVVVQRAKAAQQRGHAEPAPRLPERHAA